MIISLNIDILQICGNMIRIIYSVLESLTMYGDVRQYGKFAGLQLKELNFNNSSRCLLTWI